MKPLSQNELSYLLSLSVDDALTGPEKERLEAYLADHPEARHQLQDLLEVKRLLAAKNAIAPNPFFWTRLSETLKNRDEEQKNLLPFPSKYVPLASALGILVFIALGVTVFLQREPLLRYLSDQSEAVQQVYENSILKGAVMPLFADLGNDDVLQYALFGTLPLDKESETALRVDEGSAEGYKIEVGLTAEQRPPQVTVHELLKEIRTSEDQAHQIDSVLREARERIGRAAFYSENNALAIDPAITRLNRVVLSNIAGVLAPAQRARFDRFLYEKNAAYSIAASAARGSHPREPQPPHRADPLRDFIVITPDSFLVTALGLDIDSIVGPWSVNIRHRVPDMQARLETLVRSRVERHVAPHVKGIRPEARVRVGGQDDILQIEVDPQIVGREGESMRVVVEPRGQRNRFFRFEFRTGPEGRETSGEVRIGMQNNLDSIMRRIQEEQEAFIRDAIRMDSVMRERANVQSHGQKKIRVDSLED